MDNIQQKQNIKDNTAEMLSSAVRAVGFIKPKFDPQQQGFLPPQLEVIGTAFLLKDKQVIITCDHVVRQFANLPVELAGILVIGQKGNYRPVSIDSVDYAHDLAILRFKKLAQETDEQFNQFLKTQFDSGLELSNEYAEVSEKVAYTGFPLGNQLLTQLHEPTYFEGVIGIKVRNSDIRKEVQISGSVIGGFSGSPIVNKNNQKVVAMVSNSPSPEAGSAGIFMGVSWEHIKAIADLAKS
jgi:S1-C subfamily serine protease